MRFDGEGKKALDQLQARATCKLAEIHRLLAPDLEAPFTTQKLLETTMGRFAELPPAQQEKLRLKAIVAYAELDQLMNEMSRYVADIGDELQHVRVHTQAVTAYRRAPMAPVPPRLGCNKE